MRNVKANDIPILTILTFCAAMIATGIFKAFLEIFPDFKFKWEIYDVTFRDGINVFIVFLILLCFYYVLRTVEYNKDKED